MTGDVNAEDRSGNSPGRTSPPLALAGAILVAIAVLLYAAAVVAWLVAVMFSSSSELALRLFEASAVPLVAGVVLAAVDIIFFLPSKRQHERRIEESESTPQRVMVALTSYNDEESIGLAVEDFIKHPLVSGVIVVDNNSTDGSARVAAEAGAVVISEVQGGYGFCVHRCLTELMKRATADLVVVCEGDMTFRARDLEKLLAFSAHADIVNGTRIVEQLRAYDTQLSTFIYYGNFIVGKLLEIKHVGKGTFTDVGTTYKLMRREILDRLLPRLDPRINLPFNAYFLDRALSLGYLVVECPITFHRRVGNSKGGNASNMRAFKVGLQMVWGLLTDWKVASR